MQERMSVQALKGRSRGVMVGSLIAFGWAFYGASLFSAGLRALTLAVAAAISGLLLIGAVSMLRQARPSPAETSAGSPAIRRASLWFWVNLVGEIVLLNVAIGLLNAPDLHRYWLPAISAVVGVHFWPMAIFFRARSYWYVGAAMMLGAVVAALVIACHGDIASAVAYVEGLVNALILWSALGSSVVISRVRRADL